MLNIRFENLRDIFQSKFVVEHVKLQKESFGLHLIHQQ